MNRLNRHRAFRAVVGGGCAAALVGAAGAMAGGVGPLEVIYTKIATDPSSVVPGARDLAGMPAATNWRALEDLVMSPDGSLWVVKGRTQQGPDLETNLVMGSGRTGTTFSQEGQPIPTGAAGELFEFFGSGLGRFNNNNFFAYSARARGGLASTFQKVLVWDGGSQSINFQMGDLYFGMSDLAPNPSGDETVGNSVGSIHILDNEVVGAQDSTILGVHTSRRPAIFYDRVKFKQANIDTVRNLADTANETWAAPDANGFYTTPDGLHWMATGTIVAPATSNDVLTFDGRVRIQEASAIPGSATIVSTIVAADLRASGDWIARGAITGGGLWVARNGALFAKTGDLVEGAGPGTEVWAAAPLVPLFSAVTHNNVDDVIVVGKTNNASLGLDDVVVFYDGANPGTGQVIIREGDPVDLDGDGMFDDSVFIGRGVNTNAAFEPNDFNLTDDGWLYFFPNLRDGALSGNDLNSTPAFGTPQAFLRMRVFVPVCDPTYDLNGDGAVNALDTALLLGAWGPCAVTRGAPCPFDFNSDGVVNALDMAQILGAWCQPE